SLAAYPRNSPNLLLLPRPNPSKAAMATPRPPCVLMNRVVFFVGDTLDDGTSGDAFAGMPIGWS
uniref:Uncharacterized protein n=1 Tax=Oryza brachyantha TaxID=4533 RepID=J3L3T4_ORYBR